MVDICIDPRIELISIVQMLSGDPLVTQHDFVYKREAQTYFSAYQDHAAVTLFRMMSLEGFTFETVPRAILCLDNPPQLQQKLSFDQDVIERAGSEQQLWDFVALLRDFAQQSDYMHFFSSQKLFYEMVLAQVSPIVEANIIQLRDYFGMPLKDATFILGLLLHQGGFGTSHERNGRLYIHALIGPRTTAHDQPVFGPDQFITEMVDHEFSHTVINPLTDAHAEQINSLAHLYGLVARRMQGQIGPNWSDCVTEHIMRAVTARIVCLRYGERAARGLLHKHQAWGFLYIPRLLKALKYYKTQRDTYPTFESFYPELLAAFEHV